MVAIAICLAGLTMSSGCDPNDKPEESISLDKTTLTIAIGESETLVATAVPANTAVIWTSNNASAVVENGKITGKVEGTAVITVTKGDKTATCEVTVRGALINGVVWALRNVDAPGNFVAKSEDVGM